MVTVLHNGLRVVIYTDDHLPAHVHVFGDGEAKINLAGVDGPELVSTKGMSRSEARRALQLVMQHRDELRVRWEELHGPID